MTLAGECRAMSFPIKTAAPSEAAAPTSITPGSRFTAKLERNSASRVARPMTCAAMAPADVRTAVATKVVGEGDLDVTLAAGLEASPISYQRRAVAAARNAFSRLLRLFRRIKRRRGSLVESPTTTRARRRR